jgi:M6 family metalloprotease-like protein
VLASKLLSKVNIGDYDSNVDGKVDHAWFVLASKGIGDDPAYGFMVAGRSANNNVDMFVDGQASFAVKDTCIGCFNHEVAHGEVVGLPDLYGSFSNLGQTSLMSHPWGENPGGFLAYELLKLGWMTDYVVIAQGTESVQQCLYPMEQEFRAVLIETGDLNEFFMLEYHKRPESGWGSGWVSPMDGVLITHIVPSGSNNAGPFPLIRLESADGDLQYSAAWPTETDLWYPENPNMPENEFVGNLYNGAEVVTVGNFFRDGSGAICFDVDTK